MNRKKLGSSAESILENSISIISRILVLFGSELVYLGTCCCPTAWQWELSASGKQHNCNGFVVVVVY